MFSFFDEALAATMMAMRQPIESFIKLETSDDAQTLVADDGSLVTIVRLHGSRQIIGDEEYKWIVDQATVKLGSRFDRVGYAMQVYFMRDASMVQREIDRCMRGNRSAARAIELQLNDLLNERSSNLARYMAHEEVYLVLWTRPGSAFAQRPESRTQAACRKEMGQGAERPVSLAGARSFAHAPPQLCHLDYRCA